MCSFDDLVYMYATSGNAAYSTPVQSSRWILLCRCIDQYCYAAHYRMQLTDCCCSCIDCCCRCCSPVAGAPWSTRFTGFTRNPSTTSVVVHAALLTAKADSLVFQASRVVCTVPHANQNDGNAHTWLPESYDNALHRWHNRSADHGINRSLLCIQ